MSPALKYWDATTSSWKLGAVGLPSGQVWQQIIGDGAATSFQVTHGFGTRSVYVSVYRNSPPYEEVEADVERTDTSSVTVRTYPTVPAVSEFIAVVASAGTAATANITMDTWHIVGAAGEPAFQNSWASVAGFPTVAFRRFPDGTVAVRGAVSGGTAGGVIFTLPVGYRPPVRAEFAPAGAPPGPGLPIGTTVLADGTVVPSSSMGNARLSLAVIEFDTESVLQTASVTAQPLDAVHFIGAVGEPTFAGTWVNLDNNAAVPGSATQRAAGFRKDAFGKVRLTGVIKGGSNGQTMFTLPAGYRPRTSELSQITYASLGLAALSVSSAGVVAATGVASGNITTWVYLDGFEFDTESVAAYSTGSFPYLPITMDPWHAIGASGEPAFQNSWANAAGSAPVAFRKDSAGVVHLHGGTANGTNNTTILTLPVGYRPPSTRFFVVLGDAGAAGNYVSIDPNGVILGTRSATTLHLGDIEFDTESVLQTASVAAQPLDTWHTLGAAGEPTFAAGFSSGGSATDFAPAFRKDPAGRVSLRGVLAGPNSGGTGFTLPAGYRPALPAGQTIRYNRFPITVDGVGGTAGIGYCYITDSGSVTLLITGTSGTSARWDLSGIEFDTDTQTSYPSAFVQINAPARVTTLPTSPVDGQECYYVADATNGVLWHLRFNAGSSSAYKWEVVGSSTALLSEVATAEAVSSATYVNLATVGPTVTLPLAGDYVVEHGTEFDTATSNVFAAQSYAIGATAAVDADFVELQASTGGTRVFGSRRQRRNALAATTLQAKYRTSGSVTFSKRWLSATPVRVG
jgi:hypothetical protein